MLVLLTTSALGITTSTTFNPFTSKLDYIWNGNTSDFNFSNTRIYGDDIAFLVGNSTGSSKFEVNTSNGVSKFVTSSLQVWDDAEGTNDYLQLYHDGTNPIINSGASNLLFKIGGGSTLTLSATALTSSTTGAMNLGSGTGEFKGLYLSEDTLSGAYFGLNQDWRMYYNETSDDALWLEGATDMSIVTTDLKIWDSAKTSYLKLYFDGAQGHISSPSGGNILFVDDSLYPYSGGLYVLGSNVREWKSLYLGEGSTSGVYFGLDQNSQLRWSTAQATSNTMVWGLDATEGNSLLMVPDTYQTDDFDHPAMSDPTIFIHDNTDPDTNNTRYMALSHDGSAAVIDSGTDEIDLEDSVYVAGNLNVADHTVGSHESRMCYNGSQMVYEGESPSGDLWSCGPNDSGSWVCANITSTSFTCN